jgi:hypothetical protein
MEYHVIGRHHNDAARAVFDVSADWMPSGLCMVWVRAGQVLALKCVDVLIVALRAPVILRKGLRRCKILQRQAYYLTAEHAEGVDLECDGACMLLMASKRSWQALIESMQANSAHMPTNFPGLWSNAQHLALWSLRVARRASRSPSTLQPADCFVLANAMYLAQQQHTTWAGRCPGRWLKQRNRMLVKLLKARQFLELQSVEQIPMVKLCAIAEMARPRLVLFFRIVLEESIHDQFLRQRAADAQHNLAAHGMSAGLPIPKDQAHQGSRLARRAVASTLIQHSATSQVAPSTLEGCVSAVGSSPMTSAMSSC